MNGGADNLVLELDNNCRRLLYSGLEDLIMPVSADLGKTLEAYVADLVRTGRYLSESEVLREGVRLVQEREARLAALDAAIARGVADADAGRVAAADSVFDRLEAKYEALAKADRT